jgi:hypothetical protein
MGSGVGSPPKPPGRPSDQVFCPDDKGFGASVMFQNNTDKSLLCMGADECDLKLNSFG